MASINQQASSATSGNAVTTPTSAPFKTSTEMEALQVQLGALRLLKPNSSDEQNEAYYRRGVYTKYDESLAALSNTNDSTSTALKTAQEYLTYVDGGVTKYYQWLAHMDSTTEERPLLESLQGMINVTELFERGQHACFGCFLAVQEKLTDDLKDVGDAIDRLDGVLHYSSHDHILNMNESQRLLRELLRRESQIDACKWRIETATTDAWDAVETLCDVAARFLRGSKLKNEDGIDELCDWVERIGEEVGDLDIEVDVEEDDFMSEG